MRAANKTLLMGAALALPYLAVWAFFPGKYSGKLVWSGLIAFLAICAMTAWQWAAQGRRADQYADEREQAIVSKSALSTFWVIAVVLQGYYAWRFATVGPSEPSFWLVAALWGSFAVAYVYNRIRM